MPYVIGEPGGFGNDVTGVFCAATLEPLAALAKAAGTRAGLYRGPMEPQVLSGAATSRVDRRRGCR